MKRIFSALLVTAVALTMCIGAVPVQAQENTTNQTTAVEQDNANRTMRIDSTTTITSWHYDASSQQFVLQVEAEIPTTLTGAESLPRGEGMRSAGIKQTQLYTGSNTVSVPAQQFEGVAVISVTTPKSIQEERQVIIQSGERGDNNPLSTLGGTSGVFTGVLSTVFLSLLAAGFVVWRESNGVEVAD